MTGNFLSVELMNKSFEYKIFICRNVIDDLKSVYEKTKNYEVGGVLLGRMNLSNSIAYIEDLCKIKSEKVYRFEYFRNARKAQRIINMSWKNSNGIKNYFGEWHTHPEISPSPSVTDIRSIIGITNDRDSLFFPYTLLLIMGKDFNISLTICDKKEVIECIHIQ